MQERPAYPIPRRELVPANLLVKKKRSHLALRRAGNVFLLAFLHARLVEEDTPAFLGTRILRRAVFSTRNEMQGSLLQGPRSHTVSALRDEYHGHFSCRTFSHRNCVRHGVICAILSADFPSAASCRLLILNELRVDGIGARRYSPFRRRLKMRHG